MRGRYHSRFTLSVPTYHVRGDAMWWFVCPCHCVSNSIPNNFDRQSVGGGSGRRFSDLPCTRLEAQPSLAGEVLRPGSPALPRPARPAPAAAARRRGCSAAAPLRPSPRQPAPGPARSGPTRPGSARPAGFSPVAPAALREPLPPSPWPLPAAGCWPAARLGAARRGSARRGSPPAPPLPAPRSAPEPPARLASSELRWCCAAPPPLPPFPPRLLKKAVFSVVGERKSASSKISEVQVHQIFLLAACYTLRESDCRAPSALLAVRGCSCFPLSQRQKQKWNLLTLSAVPSPVVVAVADLQALWINSKAGNKRSLLAAIISH